MLHSRNIIDSEIQERILKCRWKVRMSHCRLKIIQDLDEFYILRRSCIILSRQQTVLSGISCRGNCRGTYVHKRTRELNPVSCSLYLACLTTELKMAESFDDVFFLSPKCKHCHIDKRQGMCRGGTRGIARGFQFPSGPRSAPKLVEPPGFRNRSSRRFQVLDIFNIFLLFYKTNIFTLYI